jgi:hypothetical protein
MQRLRRGEKPTTLPQLFMSRLDENHNAILAVYHSLFSILTEKMLFESLLPYYEYWSGDYRGDDSQWYKENWFQAFHKSIRQCDFFNDCSVSYKNPEFTEDERLEVKALWDQYQKIVKTIPEDDALTATENVAKWRAAWKEQLPVEYDRYQELIKKGNIKIKEDISGYLDSALWNLIHLDINNELYGAMKFAFMLYQHQLTNGK